MRYRPRLRHRRPVVVWIGLLLLLGALATPAALARYRAASSPLHQAWSHAQRLGAYRFDAEIDMTLRPQARLENVGLSSTRRQFKLAGKIDRSAQAVDLQLRPADGGSALLELHSAEGLTRSRVGDGDWKTEATPLEALAPGGDLMAYLVAARNIRSAQPAGHAGDGLTRYQFDIDGPAFAALMREQLGASLGRVKGLPPGVQLDMTSAYLAMTGSGEVWLDAAGLPQRQVIRISLPDDARGQLVESTLSARFFDFPPPSPLARPARWVPQFDWQTHSANLALFAVLLTMLAALARAPRSRPAYTALVLLTVGATILTPLLQADQLSAFAAERDLAAQQFAAQPPLSTPRPAFDPQRAPLAAPAAPPAAPDSSDGDADGLSDAQELALGTTATITDTDGDSLMDGIEVLELGTRPDGWDSDGDGLGDGLEVKGFSSADGRSWYLDPFNPDSNGDGRDDLSECVGATFCPDSDGDGAPDAFDDDNDGDGVPDRLDSSPLEALGGGRAPGGGLLPLDGGGFALDLQGYAPGKPILVDFTLRPANPGQLWYNGNVLDWPADDRKGQIQRVHDTTFGTSGNAADGDMRLVPMLEISIPYRDGQFGGLPLKAGVGSVPPIPTISGRSAQDAQAQASWFDAWLDREKLQSYQVAVRVKDASSLLAYLPLDTLRDPVSDAPVAFSGRMFYRPFAASLGGAHSVRLAWTLDMLRDSCTPPPAADSAAGESFNLARWNALPADQREGDYKPWKELRQADRSQAWCADPAKWTTSSGPVHSYYEDFYISALDVRQELGVEVAVALQDASAGTAGFQPALWNLARGLDRAFVGGRDCATTGAGGTCVRDGQRDITVAEIKRRFDRASNGGVPDSARWGIPAGALRVATYSFAEEGEIGRLSVGHIAGGQQQQPYLLGLLNSAYVSGATAAITNPTVLLARESTTRVARLSDGATISAQGVSFDLAGVPSMTRASLNWQPFRYRGASLWEADKLDSYWAGLDAVYAPLLRQHGGDVGADDTAVAGATSMLKHFYMGLVGGRTQLVAVEDTPVATADGWRPDAALQLPQAAPAALAEVAEQMAALVVDSQQHRSLLIAASPRSLLDAIGRQQLYQDGGPGLSLLQGLGDLGGATSANHTMNAALVGLASNLTRPEPEAEATLNMLKSRLDQTTALIDLADGVEGALGTLETFRAWKESVQVTKNVKSLMQQVDDAPMAVDLLSDLTDQQANLKKLTSKIDDAMVDAKGPKAAVLAAVVEIITAVGKLVALVQADNVNFVNVATIVIEGVVGFVIGFYLMGALAAIVPIGTIIVALIAIIDVVAALICGFSDAGKSEEWWTRTLCAGITENLVRVVMAIFWDTSPIVDMKANDRLDFVNWDFQPRDPATGKNTGFLHGNRLDVSVDIVTRLSVDSYVLERTASSATTQPGQPADPLARYEATVEDMREATFRYEFTIEEQDDDERIHERLALDTDQMRDAWRREGLQQVATQTLTTSLMLDRPAINWRPDALYLAEGYATPSMLCVLAACTTYTEDDSIYMNMADGLSFDVFPNTLDGFYSLSDRGGGAFALQWDSGFPVLADADGDGLRSKARGGTDPSDNSPDADSDGLSDFYELQHAGKGFDPSRADGDADGLSDLQEVLRQTDPAMADIDNDGLSDGAELAGWEIVFGYDAQNNPLRFRTTSDPRDPDTDDDGILDRQEKTYGFNPRVFNSGTVLTILSQIDERDGLADGIVADNSLIGYGLTISNTLRDRYALGLAEIGLPAQLSGSLPPRSYLLGPLASTTLSGTLALADLSVSAKTTLVNRAGAIIADLRGLAGGRIAWLHLDESNGAASFADSSTFGNGAVCEPASPCPQAGITSYSGRGIRIDSVGGKKTVLRIPHSASLPDDRFSLAVWVKPIQSASYQDLLVKQAGPGSQVSYVLGLGPDSLKPRLVVQSQSCAATTELGSIGQLRAGAWNLLSATYDGSKLRLYLNGVRDAELAYSQGICDSSAPLQIGNAADGTEIDELSIYRYALDDAEVQALFRDPILSLSFDGTTADSSQLGQPTDPEGRESIGLINREAGKAAQFDKKRWLRVGPSNELDLSGGAGMFTLAAWMRPVPLGPDLNSWVGVLGRENGNSTYPSIQARFGSTDGNGVLRAVFGNGSARCESAATGAWLAPGQWQHIAVSFTGTQFVFYQNGVQRDVLALPSNCAGNPRPAPGNELQIGRIGPSARFELLKLVVTDEGDASDEAELDAYWNGSGTPFWSNDAVDDTTGNINGGCGIGCYTSVGGTLQIGSDADHTYRLMEDDGDANLSWADDELLNKTVRGNEVTTGNANATKEWSYSADGAGTLTYRIWNDYFNGEIDEVKIFRSALSQPEAEALYRVSDRSTALQLRLEEPPAAYLFRDNSGALQHGLCAGASCPTSGLPGRDGQAVRFAGGQSIVVPDRPALDLPNSFTAAAWVRLDSPAATQQLLGKWDAALGGFSLGVAGGQLSARLRDLRGNLYTLSGGSVPANTWAHLALTASAGGYLVGYVNGVEVARTPLLETGRRAVAEGQPRANWTSATLWHNPGYQDEGDSSKLVVNGDIADLAYTHQNETSSVSIGDACVDLYEDNNYVGLMRIVCDNTPALGSHDNDTDSLRFYKTPASASAGALALDAGQRQSVVIDPAKVNQPNFSAISIAARVDLDQTGGTHTIASRGNNNNEFDDGLMDVGFRFDIVNGTLRFSAGNGSWQSNAGIDANEHHVAVTLGAGQVRFYIDGVLRGAHGFGGNVNDLPDRPLLLGRAPDCGGRSNCDFFDGRMRQVAFFTRPLSDAEVTSLRDGRLQDVDSVGRAFYLPFDESNGSTSFGMPVVEPLGVNDQPLTLWGNGSAGMLDEVLLLEQALPPSEVQALMGRAPVLSLPLDESAGATSFDNQAGGLPDAASSGASQPKAGAQGRIRDALVFDGADDRIWLADHSAFDLNRFAIELWVRPGARKGLPQPLVAKAPAGGSSPNYLLELAPNSLNLRLHACATTLASAKPLNQDQWNHVVASYDGAALRLYLNGTLDSSQARSGNLCANASELSIGGLPGYGAAFDGMLDELVLYGQALDAAEVQAHYSYQEAWFDIAERYELTIDADNPTVSVAQAEGTVIPNRETLLAVIADDPTSPVVSVEYDVGSGWQPAAREDALWLFSYTPTANGPVSINVRATDSVGHRSQSTRGLIVDGTPPTPAISPALSSGVLRPSYDDASAAWVLPLSGTASDARSASRVIVTLHDAGGIVGQPVTLPNVSGAWSSEYRFPFAPNGRYTLEIMAEDAVGNRSAPLSAVLTLDATAPVGDVTVGQTRLGGVGAQPQRSFAPQSGQPPVVVLHGTVGDAPLPARALLSASFEEQAGAVSFLDSSLDQRRGSCIPGACPAAGVAGYGGASLSFDGLDDSVIFSNIYTAAIPSLERFTLAAWVKPQAGASGSLVSGAGEGALALDMRVVGGNQLEAYLRVNGTLRRVGQAALSPGQWNLALLSFDGASARLYVDGAALSTEAIDGPVASFDQLFVGSSLGTGGFLAAGVDELSLFGGALGDEQVRLLAAPVRSAVSQVELRLVHARDFEAPETSAWQATTLAPTGLGFATWSYTVPAGVEGIYRVDLRTTDGKGNQQVIPAVWHGAIDTLAPRVALLVRPLGDGSSRVECFGLDYNLDPASIACPAPNASWRLGYQSAPWHTALFSPTQQAETLRASAVLSDAGALSLRVCDTFGHCATAAGSPSAAIEPGLSLVLRPGGTPLVESLAPIALEGYAYAGAGLQLLEITAGGEPVESRPLGAETSLDWTSSFTPSAEGIYPIQARAHADDGRVYTDTLAPVVTVDLAAPTLSLSTTVLSASQIAAGDLALVGGLLTETHGLRLLEAMVAGGDWQPIGTPSAGAARPFGGQLALGRSGPFDGEPLTLTLRAEDLAGRSAALTRTLVLDNALPQVLSSTVSPSTTLAQIGVSAYDGSDLRLVEIGLRSPDDLGAPERAVWHPATRAAHDGMTSSWKLDVAAGGERAFVVSLRLTDEVGNQRTLTNIWSGTLITRAPQITSDSPAAASYGDAYRHELRASGDGALSFGVEGELPPGLALDPATGVLSGTPTLAGSYAFTLTAASEWLPAASQAVTLTVARRPLDVSIAGAAKVYGVANPPLTYTVAISQLVGGDGANVVVGAPATAADERSPVGGYAIVTGTLRSTNYELIVTPATLIVTPATLTVTAHSKTRRLGQANPPLELSYTGFANDDDAGDLDLAPTLATTATAASPAGSYPITVAGGQDANYSFVYVAGSLNVVEKDVPEISWSAPLTISYGTALGDAQLDAAASFGGQPVAGTFSYSPPAGTLLRAGRGQLLRVLFTPADTVRFVPIERELTIDVAPATLTVTAQSEAIVVGQLLPPLRYTIVGFVNGEDEADLDTPLQIASDADARQPGSYAISLSGGSDADYRLVFKPGVLLVQPRAPALRAAQGDTGRSGSFFEFSGDGFEPGEQVQVRVEGRHLLLVEADAEGKLAFVLRFGGAPEGSYSVSLTRPGSAAAAATTSIRLDETAPLLRAENPALPWAEALFRMSLALMLT
jgi:hypothetical protein